MPPAPRSDDAPAGGAALELLVRLQETRLALVDRVEALSASGGPPRLGDLRRAVALFFRLRRLNGAAERLRRAAGAAPAGGGEGAP